MKVGGGVGLKASTLGAKSTGTVFVNVGWLKDIRRTVAYQRRGSPGSIAVRRSANATWTLRQSSVNSNGTGAPIALVRGLQLVISYQLARHAVSVPEYADGRFIPRRRVDAPSLELPIITNEWICAVPQEQVHTVK